MNLIETNDLVKVYQGRAVVDHVNMHIPEGSIYGFVGENGSGKTTIMRLLTGLAEPTKGSYTLFGVNNKDKNIYKMRKQMSALVETASLVPTMTARENLIYQEMYLGIKLKEEERKNLLISVNLGDVGKKKVKNFSLGMRQRLAIALALINKPKLMMLDEPMNGLDPQGIAELRDLLINLNRKEGITVLISSHILSELEKIASYYGFISHGKLLLELPVEEFIERCKKSLNISVDKVNEIEEVLTKYGIKDYKIYPNGEVKIYDDNIDIGDFVSNINKNKIKILTIHSSEGSVEDFYLNLIKEAR